MAGNDATVRAWRIARLIAWVGSCVYYSWIVKMVAQKKGRGAKNQAAKAKAAAQAAEEQAPEIETSEPVEAEDNNGEAEQAEQGDEPATGEAGGAEGGDADQSQNTEGEGGDDKKEDKVESGKILVENLPSTYLFDYQEKLKELFSKHGEVTNVKWVDLFHNISNVTETCNLPTFKYQSLKCQSVKMNHCICISYWSY